MGKRRTLLGPALPCAQGLAGHASRMVANSFSREGQGVKRGHYKNAATRTSGRQISY
jgi:hypothetical protein